MRLLKKSVIFAHRYLGIGFGLRHRGVRASDITGVVFGVFTLTWAFSGLLSMVYIDPEMSQALAHIHRLNRVERWAVQRAPQPRLRLLVQPSPPVGNRNAAPARGRADLELPRP